MDWNCLRLEKTGSTCRDSGVLDRIRRCCTGIRGWGRLPSVISMGSLPIRTHHPGSTRTLAVGEGWVSVPSGADPGAVPSCSRSSVPVQGGHAWACFPPRAAGASAGCDVVDRAIRRACPAGCGVHPPPGAGAGVSPVRAPHIPGFGGAAHQRTWRHVPPASGFGGGSLQVRLPTGRQSASAVSRGSPCVRQATPGVGECRWVPHPAQLRQSDRLRTRPARALEVRRQRGDGRAGNPPAGGPDRGTKPVRAAVPET